MHRYNKIKAQGLKILSDFDQLLLTFVQKIGFDETNDSFSVGSSILTEKNKPELN